MGEEKENGTRQQIEQVQQQIPPLSAPQDSEKWH